MPVLVVGSDADETFAADRSRAVFGQLVPGFAHELFVSASSGHRDYFRETEVNATVRQFIRARCAA